MGLMSFIKEAGRKLGIGKAEATQPEGSPVPETPAADALEGRDQEPRPRRQGPDGRRRRRHGQGLRHDTRPGDQGEAGRRSGQCRGRGGGRRERDRREGRARGRDLRGQEGRHAVGDRPEAIRQGSKYMAIFEANRPMLKDPGQDLSGPGAAHPAGARGRGERRRPERCRRQATDSTVAAASGPLAWIRPAQLRRASARLARDEPTLSVAAPPARFPVGR